MQGFLQGWPKFTQNLWYATPDNGIAALVYAPSEVKALVANHQEVTFKEETNYPFDESVKFTLHTSSAKALSFPFSLRIPAWCTQATVKVNGKVWYTVGGNQITKIEREWKSGDVVDLELPMHIFKNTWNENSVSVERGPITYALKIQENVTKVKNEKDPGEYGDTFYEVRPASAWNYGLVNVADNKLDEKFKVEKRDTVSRFPWTLNSAPIMIRAKARQIPGWHLYNEMAGPLPYTFIYNQDVSPKTEDIILVPYGCTEIRISEFPVVNDK